MELTLGLVFVSILSCPAWPYQWRLAEIAKVSPPRREDQVEPLFSQGSTNSDYQPRRPAGFRPDRIVLARGSRSSASREQMAEAICRLYPEARCVEAQDTPHNRVPIAGRSALEQHYNGKRTLVLGEHRSAVRLSEESDNTCPNYWHFSPYGFCPYDCKYCYLAGTQGVRFCPAVKVFLNLDEMLTRIADERRACGAV